MFTVLIPLLLLGSLASCGVKKPPLPPFGADAPPKDPDQELPLQQESDPKRASPTLLKKGTS